MYGHRPPNAAQLDRQMRQAGLTTAIKAYPEDPDTDVLLGPTAWVNLGESPPTLKAFKDGEIYTLSGGGGGPTFYEATRPGTNFTTTTQNSYLNTNMGEITFTNGAEPAKVVVYGGALCTVGGFDANIRLGWSLNGTVQFWDAGLNEAGADFDGLSFSGFASLAASTAYTLRLVAYFTRATATAPLTVYTSQADASWFQAMLYEGVV